MRQTKQRGIVLFIALIVLVAMTLAGIAMFRQIGSGVIIAGNIAFRENATSVADLGVVLTALRGGDEAAAALPHLPLATSSSACRRSRRRPRAAGAAGAALYVCHCLGPGIRLRAKMPSQRRT